MNGNQMSSPPTVILRMREICERTTLSESFIHELRKRGVFPPAVSLGPRARGCPEDELDLWLAQCLALRKTMARLTDSVVLPQWGPPVLEVPCQRIVMLHREEVELRTSYEHSQLYRLMELRLFPWPAPFADKARRWAAHEVEAWLRERRLERFRDLKAGQHWECSPPGPRPDPAL